MEWQSITRAENSYSSNSGRPSGASFAVTLGLGAVALPVAGTFHTSAEDPRAAQALHDVAVALIAFVSVGALLGFLPYNFPKATAFLGDSGSHLVGFLLAILAILPHFYSRRHPEVLAVFKPLLVLAVPLIDLVWVVILRWKSAKPFYLGDTNHLSHRLVRRGWSRTGAVLLIWLLAAVTGGLALW